jgi:hypothetical protein
MGLWRLPPPSPGFRRLADNLAVRRCRPAPDRSSHAAVTSTTTDAVAQRHHHA